MFARKRISNSLTIHIVFVYSFCRKQKLQIKQTRLLKLVTSLSDGVMNPESKNFEEVWGLYSFLCNENVNKSNHFCEEKLMIPRFWICETSDELVKSSRKFKIRFS